MNEPLSEEDIEELRDESVNDKLFYRIGHARKDRVNAEIGEHLLATIGKLQEERDKWAACSQKNYDGMNARCLKLKEENENLKREDKNILAECERLKNVVEDLEKENDKLKYDLKISKESGLQMGRMYRELGDERIGLRDRCLELKKELEEWKAIEWKDEEWEGEYGSGDLAEKRAIEIVTKYHSKWAIIWALAHELRQQPKGEG